MKIHATSMPPLVRPKLLIDEWTETYLFRIARANGIRTPKLSDIERFRRAIPETVQTTVRGYPTWCNTTFTRRMALARPNKIRYCPACMTESRHIRSRWRLKLFEICTIHHLYLKDDLAEPSMTRGYLDEDRYFVEDVTDAQLWAGATCPMPDERRHVAQIWARFERVIATNDLADAMELLASAVFVEAILDAIATKERDSDYWLKDERRVIQMTDLVRRHGLHPIATRDGIRDFLHSLNIGLHRGAVLARMRLMLIEEESVPTCLSNFPIEMLRDAFLLEDKSRFERRHKNLIRVRNPHLAGYLSLDKARQVIGCSHKLLMLFIEKSIIRNIEVVQHSRRQLTYIALHEVDTCRKWYASVSSPEIVMRELHIHRRAYVALLGAGLLAPLSFNEFSFIQRSDLTVLSQRLEDFSRPYTEDVKDPCPLFGDWMLWNWLYTAKVQSVLKSAFNGRLVIFRDTSRLGLSRFLIERKAIAHIQTKMAFGDRNKIKYIAESGQLSLFVS